MNLHLAQQMTTSGLALQLYKRSGCVCSMLGLDLQWRDWNAPSYRSLGRPRVWASFAERNGALHYNALSRLFQLEHSSICDCRVVQEWLSLQADVELSNKPPRAPDMKHNENMWSEVKRTIQETWPILPPRIAMSYGPWSQARWMKSSSQHYVRSLIESVHDWWNQWSKHRGSGLLIKEASFWKQSFYVLKH